MTEELFKLVEPELEEVNKILKKICKIKFELEGKLPLTGFKVKATIVLDNPSLSWNTTVSIFNLTQFPATVLWLLLTKHISRLITEKKVFLYPSTK